MTERIITDSNGRKHITTEPLLHTPAQQEPVSCPVCNQVHTILDADESQIIRNAKDGYPDGRTPRLLTLQERVAALCQYASDWKRWCLEKENTTPQAQPAQQEPVGEIGKIVMFGGDLKEVSWKNGKMPPAGSILYTRPQAREPEQPTTPQGWKLVPVKPTPEQIKSGNKVTWPMPCKQVYTTMLAAAPQPAQQEPVATKLETQQFSCFHVSAEDFQRLKNLPVGTKLYTRPQALEPEQPAQQQQEPYEIEWPEYHEHAMGCGLEDRDERCRYGAMRYGWDCAIEAVAQAMPDVIYTSPPASKPDFKAFKEWAVAAGYDTAHAHDGMKWVCLNPMTADLWKAWQAAHGIKENT